MPNFIYLNNSSFGFKIRVLRKLERSKEMRLYDRSTDTAAASMTTVAWQQRDTISWSVWQDD